MVIDVDSKARELSEFCGVLWGEREILERVLFRVVEQQLILKSGQARWLALASGEVESAINELRGSEVMRHAESDALAGRLGLPDGARLAELAAVATEPWRSILLEHLTALRELAAEIDAVTEQNRVLLAAGARVVRESLLTYADPREADEHHFRADAVNGSARDAASRAVRPRPRGGEG